MILLQTKIITIGDKEYLNIIKVISNNKNVLVILPVLSSGLCYTNIRMIESHVIEKKRCDNTFKVWHDQLDHPGTIMMRRITETSNEHSVKNLEIFQANELSCVACSKGKEISHPSSNKIRYESPSFLKKDLRGYMWIYVDQYIHHVDHLAILLFYLTRPLDVHTCACCLVVISFLQDYLQNNPLNGAFY